MSNEIIGNAADLSERLQKAEDGETILISGQFGTVSIKGLRMKRGVTVASAKPGSAHFERIEIRSCANITLSGLSCWPLSPVTKSKAKQYLITADSKSENIEVTNSLFRGRADSDDHTHWSKDDWQAAKIGAVFLQGPRGIIRNNAAIGVNFGFNVIGHSSEIFENTVFGFSGDGLRVAADNCVVIGNRVSDAVGIDKNHPDGFQAFKRKGTLSGLVVKDNTILEWTIRPDNPLRTRLQGLSLHDGPYENVVVRDNSVSCSSPNGIRLTRVINLDVTGNRVRHADGKRGNAPRLIVANCSGRIVVEDNQAEKFVLPKTVAGRRNAEPNYTQPY
ncbi:MAG: hypothetical protein WBB85_15855 [Albidovulum sp.]|uniref:hypothetical protein n=1 Tax=Albidovulum sp. TaxID=1872424 RepID=UPI003CB123D0